MWSRFGLIFLFAAPALGQSNAPCLSPLTQDQLLGLLRGGVPESRIEDLAVECGLAFVFAADTESVLQEAGASGALVAAIRSAQTRRRRDDDTLSCRALETSTTAAAFEEYLRQFPDGTCATYARIRRAELVKTTKEEDEHRLLCDSRPCSIEMNLVTSGVRYPGKLTFSSDGAVFTPETPDVDIGPRRWEWDNIRQVCGSPVYPHEFLHVGGTTFVRDPKHSQGLDSSPQRLLESLERAKDNGVPCLGRVKIQKVCR